METILLWVMNDILVQAEEGGTTILVLLNVSTAFDNTDHTTLINRLNMTKKSSGEVCVKYVK